MPEQVDNLEASRGLVDDLAPTPYDPEAMARMQAFVAGLSDEDKIKLGYKLPATGRARISKNLSNALKHTWRAHLHDNKRDDLEKAIQYLRQELGRVLALDQ